MSNPRYDVAIVGAGGQGVRPLQALLDHDRLGRSRGL